MKSVYRRLGASLLLVLLSVGMWPVEKAEALGMNLTWVKDWATTYVFVDAFKASRPWISHRPSDETWDSGEPFDLDELGWVRSLADDQHAGTLMVIEQGEHLPAGVYVVLYQGEGILTFDFEATVVSEAPGRIVLDVQPSGDSIGGIHMKIKETNPSNYIRNIRVIMPGFEETFDIEPFHPTYVEFLRRFETLRFMDWGEIINDAPGEWSDRIAPDHARQSTTEGVALEYMISLANTVGRDAWICVPHLATDEYVRNMAALLRDTLDPELKVYVEHSNEVWNPEYPEHTYARSQGEALGLAPGDPSLAALRYHSQRSVEIFDIFEDLYGTADRFVRVMGGQIDSEIDPTIWMAEQLLGWQNAFEKTDAYAVAPYFGYSLGTPEFAGELETLTVESVLDSAESDMRRMISVSEGLSIRVGEYNLDLVTYEAGMGMVPSGSQVENQDAVEKFADANRHERMYGIYSEYLSGWAAFGGRMTLFTDIRRFDKWGSYGHLERVNQPLSEAPKFRAVEDFLTGMDPDVGPGGGDPPAAETLVGDFDSDGKVDFEDFLQFAGAWGSGEAQFDLNDSGRVDFDDFLLFAANFGKRT